MIDTATYIAALAAELQKMARADRLAFLAFLLAMVAEEARRLAEGDRT